MTHQLDQGSCVELEEAELWRLRALAALPVIEAAMNLTQGHLYELRGKTASQTIVSTKHYEKLKDAVAAYMKAAQEEGDRHDPPA